ncbi:MAG: glycine cleavage system aminomethyltransferase GcvT [bacterium]
MLKHTPLYGQHVKLGAKLVPFAGWSMPVSYKSIIEEHRAVRTKVGMFDIGHMGLIKIEGTDALPLIQKVTTNDAAKLAALEGQYSILCNEQGGVVDDIFVYCLPMFYLIVCNASNADKVLAWLKDQAQKFSQAHVSLYENFSSLAVQGPAAEEVVGQVLDVDLQNLKRNHCLWWRDIIISRTGYTGEDGFELMVAKKEIVKIWASLLKAGVAPCGLGARDTLRLEAGFPLYGHEYDEKTTPLEVGYGWAVKFDKGEFVGRAALLKQKEAGLTRKLVGLTLDARAIPRAGDPVDGGIITSGTFSPTLKKPIALAFVSPEAKEVSIEIRGKKIPARVVAKTFYKR